ncbi:uncharacterized protein PHACADRAFT_164147 [Phanerochaete carnosa HHB-10118-sp]|uniref:Histone deacetylase domain-containing protein n=1 Tax=Phanerochaete carnosa (strain HHB-10118-sp) TaxID=650164 RepID=K5WPE5_PHACS|nr:uncharacterized protein PHACADRAFT_164147 [Phanerochaete carnosa HHB-10118-sp]EKM52217.1 hypothetical protein PHACADRAFT_164147 [Phanerochaete carnosa HHB-10118-sp]
MPSVEPKREYVSDLKVKYGDSPAEAPPNALRELTGLSNDVNQRYGGKHVWLVPSYTTDPAAAATSFHVVVQHSPSGGMDDIAKGIGGGYRYVFTKSDPDELRKITYAVLLRSSWKVATPPSGWDNISEDLNKGRRGTYLYILLKMTESEVASSNSRLSLTVPSVAGYLSVRSSPARKEYIQRLEVAYGDNEKEVPPDCIREISGLSPNLDLNGGSKCVWLVPVYTTDITKAATSFDMLVQAFEDPKFNDLARRTGGEFRYIVPRADRKQSEKIVEVGFARSDAPLERPPTGWQGYCVNDVNKGRRKRCVYIAWKTVSTNSWSFVSLSGSISPFRLGNTTSKYIKTLTVCYGESFDDMPEGAVYEYNGQSADLNHQFGGKFVWLAPEYTTDPDAAATSFTVTVSRIADLALADIAKGTLCGRFRYIVPMYDARAKGRVAEIQLFRAERPLSKPPSGWQGMSTDINEGRGRTALYLIWKTSRRAIVYTQDACLTHRNIAIGDDKSRLERPERLYAVNVGVGAIYARLEEAAGHSSSRSGRVSEDDDHGPFTIVRSTETIQDIPERSAACTVLHIKPEDGPTYAQVLEEWCKQSRQRIMHRERELLYEFEEDLYVCPGSFDAFKAAMGTVCQAVDAVAAGSEIASQVSAGLLHGTHGTRAFVAIRPPGHHCIAGAPAGLGFVNNIIVGALHAFYQHKYTHIIIFDIDLHHGNGTQRVVKEINAQRPANPANGKDEYPTMFYGSIHDIKSYPCANGDSNRISASLVARGADGQWVENIHMQPYTSEEEFWEHYEQRYVTLIERASEFVASTQASVEKTMVFISCGFSASRHEHPEMSQHKCYFPTEFYHRFTRDARTFADHFAQGRLVGVLEGGYSNRALISGVMAHVAGLAETELTNVDPKWWDLPALEEAEKVLKRQQKRKARSERPPLWVTRTRQIVGLLNEPLDRNEDSRVLAIPSRDTSVRPANALLTLSTSASGTAEKRRQASGSNPVAAKRPRSGASEMASLSQTRALSRALSELTPIPDTPRTSVALLSKALLPSTPGAPGQSSSASSPKPPPQDKAQEVYNELKRSFDSFDNIATSTAALPQAFLRAIRPVRGCVWRLEHILADGKLACDALETLEEFLSEAHSSLEQFTAEPGDRQMARRKLDRALYDLEGSALDLKNMYI